MIIRLFTIHSNGRLSNRLMLTPLSTLHVSWMVADFQSRIEQSSSSARFVEGEIIRAMIKIVAIDGIREKTVGLWAEKFDRFCDRFRCNDFLSVDLERFVARTVKLDLVVETSISWVCCVEAGKAAVDIATDCLPGSGPVDACRGWRTTLRNQLIMIQAYIRELYLGLFSMFLEFCVRPNDISSLPRESLDATISPHLQGTNEWPLSGIG